jgi:hypothetical protein
MKVENFSSNVQGAQNVLLNGIIHVASSGLTRGIKDNVRFSGKSVIFNFGLYVPMR